MLLWHEWTFEAAHSLPYYEEMHGHSYVVRVYVETSAGWPPTPDNKLMNACRDCHWFLDHKNLNNLMIYPTMENIADFIEQQLKKTDLNVKRIEVSRPTVKCGVVKCIE